MKIPKRLKIKKALNKKEWNNLEKLLVKKVLNKKDWNNLEKLLKKATNKELHLVLDPFDMK